MYYDGSTWIPLWGDAGSPSFMDMQLPSVYAYHDFRQFLKDWWEARHQQEPDLSKSEMSRRLGLPNTRSYFTDVLAGKAVTELFVARFVAALDLSVEESRFFRTLVQFNQAATPEEREVAFDGLVALNKTPYRKLDARDYRYYRHWWNGAIRAVLAIEDHVDDWDRLASRIQPAITARQAREALALMDELGLVARDERGFWKPKDAALSSGSDIREELVLQLQLQQFDLARRAIMTRFRSPKEIATSTLSLSGAGLDLVRARFERFRSEVRSIAHKDPEPADRVYSLCLALFPLTHGE